MAINDKKDLKIQRNIYRTYERRTLLGRRKSSFFGWQEGEYPLLSTVQSNLKNWSHIFYQFFWSLSIMKNKKHVKAVNIFICGKTTLWGSAVWSILLFKKSVSFCMPMRSNHPIQTLYMISTGLCLHGTVSLLYYHSIQTSQLNLTVLTYDTDWFCRGGGGGENK